MQPDADLQEGELRRGLEGGRPARGGHHAAHGPDPAEAGQHLRGLVDAGVQAEVVDAQGQARCMHGGGGAIKRKNMACGR